MGFISNQLSNVVEWNEERDDVIFYKWHNAEIKKGSRLILRHGQDAVFMFNGKNEGVFTKEGSYDIESQIIPFLSTLAGFKFGFNSGMRAEVLFVNTKEFLVKWGTKGAISIQAEGLPGGMPIRCLGTFSFKVDSYDSIIENLAGVKEQYTVDDVKERVMSELDPLLMEWISREGKDMFNLQANGAEIAKGIKSDLDKNLKSIGFTVTRFNIQNFSYPDEVRKMQETVAAQSMVGDMSKFGQIRMLDNLGSDGSSGNIAGQMMQMQMGMALGSQMMNNMPLMNGGGMINSGGSAANSGINSGGAIPKFCPSCGTPTNGMNFCGNCGYKLV